jgi:CTD small phosphatase-like protein 2
LSIFSGPDIHLDNILLIDNSISAFAFNLENGIPIQNFYGDKNDTALKLVCGYLDYIKEF